MIGAVLKPRGTKPQTLLAEGPRGRCQSHLERSLRRSCRRCVEAAVQARLRGPLAVNAQLVIQIRRDVRRHVGDVSLVELHRWACLKKWFQDRWRCHLEEQRRWSLRAWQARMQSVSKAVQWVKKPASCSGFVL